MSINDLTADDTWHYVAQGDGWSIAQEDGVPKWRVDLFAGETRKAAPFLGDGSIPKILEAAQKLFVTVVHHPELSAGAEGLRDYLLNLPDLAAVPRLEVAHA